MTLNRLSKKIYQSENPGKKFKTGIVLGGGGARGFCHLGVLQALKEKGIEPDIISGVSSGAVAGVFIANGKSPETTHKLLKDKGLLNYSRLNIPKHGLLSLEGLQEELKREIDVERIEDLATPFFAAVSNLNKGKIEYLNKGKVSDVVLASASIPILFSPVKINGSMYVDGGLFDNLPGLPLIGNCDKIISVVISQIKPMKHFDNLIGVTKRVFQLAIDSNSSMERSNSDLVIEPPGLEEYDILDTDRADELFKLGYEHVRKMNIKI